MAFSQPVPADFVRSALGEGMRFEAELGANPFEYGFIAGTDTHIAAPGAVSETNFPGHGGAGQPNIVPPEAFTDIALPGPGRPSRRLGRRELARSDLRSDAQS